MLDFEYKEHYDVNDMRKIISLLRREGGCPWDIAQSHESLKRCFLEEAYEAVDAINEGSVSHLKEELGDVMLQVVFHADIEDELGNFDLDDVADGVCRKMLFRHPHVFGNAVCSSSGHVPTTWEDIKRLEKNQKTTTEALEAVAKNIPALWRAEKLQKKAAKSGVSVPQQCMSDATEKYTNAKKNGHCGEDELGDLLFAVVSEARENNLDPEKILMDSCERFIIRFSQQERKNVELQSNHTLGG